MDVVVLKTRSDSARTDAESAGVGLWSLPTAAPLAATAIDVDGSSGDSGIDETSADD